MKPKTARLLMIGTAVLLVALVVGYNRFYVPVFGSPFKKAKEQSAVLSFYNDRHPEDFRIKRSFYDWKRREFRFTLVSDPEDLTFETTVHELEIVDRAAESKALREVDALIRDSASNLLPQGFRIHVDEDIRSADLLQSETASRLSANRYAAEIRWEDTGGSVAEAERLFDEIADAIEKESENRIPHLRIRAAVTDGDQTRRFERANDTEPA